MALSQQRLGGRLPLSRLLADAIDYARHGMPVTPASAEHGNQAR